MQNLETPILIKIIINAVTNTLFLSGIMDHVVQRDRNNSSNSFTAKTSLEKRIRAVLNFITLVPFHTICLMLGNLEVDSKRLHVSKAYAKRRTFHETNKTLISLRAEALRPS